MKKRLAIVGGGSSGLITLKMALDFLPDWEIVCFEKSDSIVGCWGNPYPGFVSTSTRYTTQFACFPICDASVNEDGGTSREEFFRNDEYGTYLNSFAEHFGLRKYIRLNTRVDHIRKKAHQWKFDIGGESSTFDAVVICTGLAATPKPVDCKLPQLSTRELNHPDGLGHVRGKKIVIVGGGESAVDYANRLANPKLNNEVLLSLRSGIRVSPRYHPVRGVPSDFLRNRLMLSVDPDIRNWLGQIFVKLRIKYERQFRKLFPHKQDVENSTAEDEINRRKEWTMRLTIAAKDDLFNMFHNKSDDFLEAVGAQRIRIVGTATNDSWTQFNQFESAGDRVSFEPEFLIPATGYRSTIGKLTDERISLRDFHLGCCHIRDPGLFLVGFARPIIGNIPTISEMQARYVCGQIAGKFERPKDIEQCHANEQAQRETRFAKLDMDSVYAVEMFPYCDRLARLMKLKTGPRVWESPMAWWKTKLAPASTLQYREESGEGSDAQRYMPATLVAFIVLMKPVDWAWKAWKKVMQ
jgi:cation diffusion facilitator CzcD-associated flavoprotein CzcO